MLQRLNVTTQTGMVLNGCIFKAKAAKTAVILITGVEGNIHNNPFYTTIGKQLETVGVDLVVAHTRDAFNRVTEFNKISKKRETYGSFNEDFNNSDDDVEAYLRFAYQRGYQHIVLGGQSLGANKVIHYLATHPNARIDKFLLLSPVNVETMRQDINLKQRQVISDWIKEGKASQLLPFRLFRWLSSTARTGSYWLTDDTLNNVHPESNGDFSQLESIQHCGALVIGTHDRFPGGNPVHYLKNINDHIPTKKKNQLIYMRNAGHIYRHQEKVLAQMILRLLNQWQSDGDVVLNNPRK